MLHNGKPIDIEARFNPTLKILVLHLTLGWFLNPPEAVSLSVKWEKDIYLHVWLQRWIEIIMYVEHLEGAQDESTHYYCCLKQTHRAGLSIPQ